MCHCIHDDHNTQTNQHTNVTVIIYSSKAQVIDYIQSLNVQEFKLKCIAVIRTSMTANKLILIGLTKDSNLLTLATISTLAMILRHQPIKRYCINTDMHNSPPNYIFLDFFLVTLTSTCPSKHTLKPFGEIHAEIGRYRYFSDSTDKQKYKPILDLNTVKHKDNKQYMWYCECALQSWVISPWQKSPFCTKSLPYL